MGDLAVTDAMCTGGIRNEVWVPMGGMSPVVRVPMTPSQDLGAPSQDLGAPSRGMMAPGRDMTSPLRTVGHRTAKLLIGMVQGQKTGRRHRSISSAELARRWLALGSAVVQPFAVR